MNNVGSTAMHESRISPFSKSLNNPWLILGLLGLVNLFNYMDRVLFSVLLEPIRAELHLSDAQLGVLGGFSFALFYAIFGLLIGRLADKYNRVWIMTGALALWSLASAACGLAKNFGGLFLARMGVGVGEAGCVPAGHSLIGDYFPPRKRALAVSIFTGVGTIGSLVGLVFGAALAETYGWRLVFVIFGLPGLAFVLVLRLLLREPERGRFDQVQHAPPQKFLAALARLWSRPTARHLLLGIPLYYVGVGASVWIPSFFLRAHGVSIGEFGATGGLALGLGTVLGTFGGGYLVNWLIGRERRWEFWWPALASLISVPLLAFAYTLPTTNLAYIFLFAGTLVMASGIGASMSCLQVVAEPALRATAVGLMLLGTSLIGYGAGPALVGILSDWFAASIDGNNGASLRFGLLCALALPLWSSVHFYLASRRVHEDAVN